MLSLNKKLNYGVMKMNIGYVLYNSKAGTSNNIEDIKRLDTIVGGNLKYIDILNVTNYSVFLSGLEENDFLVISGGDGTLNRFVNDTDGIDFNNEILYFPNGTGNDFAHDLGHSRECKPFPITEYMKNLPYVIVNGKKYRFINGIGYGIDGYCCEEGDMQRETSGKTINYTSIAIKGLLFHYKPTNAKISVDGKTHTYKKVWLSPTMNGRFYGGGMMPTPNQKRNSDKLTTMVFHSSGKLKTLIVFPSLFKGEHIKHTKNIAILEGKEITVEYDRPTPLQIDGETISGVTSYTAIAPAVKAEEHSKSYAAKK